MRPWRASSLALNALAAPSAVESKPVASRAWPLMGSIMACTRSRARHLVSHHGGCTCLNVPHSATKTSARTSTCTRTDQEDAGGDP